MSAADPTSNPLRHATGASWDRLIVGTNPAAMLVAIGGMMGRPLRQRFEVDDVWQETLLHAWHCRDQFEWRGPDSFRRWLLAIARHRVHDLADHSSADKRGGGREIRFGDRDTADTQDADHYAGPGACTTPGRAAADRELAGLFERALDEVEGEHRAVVRLRLFEDDTFESIAGQLGFGVEAARYRFRLGVEQYRRALRRLRAIATGSP